jgi:hypothetical protein
MQCISCTQHPVMMARAEMLGGRVKVSARNVKEHDADPTQTCMPVVVLNPKPHTQVTSHHVNSRRAAACAAGWSCLMYTGLPPADSPESLIP